MKGEIKTCQKKFISIKNMILTEFKYSRSWHFLSSVTHLKYVMYNQFIKRVNDCSDGDLEGLRKLYLEFVDEVYELRKSYALDKSESSIPFDKESIETMLYTLGLSDQYLDFKRHYKKNITTYVLKKPGRLETRLFHIVEKAELIYGAVPETAVLGPDVWISSLMSYKDKLCKTTVNEFVNTYKGMSVKNLKDYIRNNILYKEPRKKEAIDRGH